MLSYCCKNKINVMDVDENQEENQDEIDIKKIKKSLCRTKKNNHIGYGISSNIFKIKLNGSVVSCKVFKNGWETHANTEITILKEITKLNSKYFSKFLYNFKLNLRPVICYEYINGVDLFTYISDNNIFFKNEKYIFEIIKNILYGLKKLMEIDLLHLDLKPENIIIQQLDPIKIKLIDFSFCHDYKKTELVEMNGTIGYIAPEILFRKKVYQNTDIWSVGIIIYLLYFNKFMFGIEEESYVYNTVCTSRTKININKNIINCSENIKEIITKCLIYNTTHRISINSLIKLIKKISAN
jgi:serine/threonine protein kinase